MRRKSRHQTLRRIGLVSCRFAVIGLIWLFAPPAPAWPETKRDKTAAPGDCGACHTQARVLPEGHPATSQMTMDGCKECHDQDGVQLKGKLPGSHVHHLAGTACGDCHENIDDPKAVPTKKCFVCHGPPQKVVEMTAAIKPNPHNSPHYGPELDCDLCHHLHKKSENFCNECHSYEFVIP